MTGTAHTPIFFGRGDYQSFTVDTAAITLGQVVCLISATPGSVKIGTAATKTLAIGVATSVRRLDITQTTSEAAVGEKVTVAMKHSGAIVYVEASGTVTCGELVEAANAGEVATHTAATGAYDEVIGVALTTATDDKVKIQLI